MKKRGRGEEEEEKKEKEEEEEEKKLFSYLQVVLKLSKS